MLLGEGPLLTGAGVVFEVVLTIKKISLFLVLFAVALIRLWWFLSAVMSWGLLVLGILSGDKEQRKGQGCSRGCSGAGRGNF